jgi:tetratricopeptide (TPR) repeat protein
LRTHVGIRAGGLSLSVLLAVTSVRAQQPEVTPPAPPPASDAEQSELLAMDVEARQHFQLGRTFYDSGRFQQAVEEFSAAYKLSGRPQLLYNLYVANRDAGELPAAVDALRAYLDKVPDAPDRVNLKARLESLEAQAKRQAEQEALAKQAGEAERRAAEPATRTELKRSPVPWVLAGAGGALLIGSIATGVVAKGKADDLDKACGGTVCPSSQEDNVQTTRRLAITTDVLLGVGGALAVTGVVLWLTGALDEERQVPVSVAISGSGVSTTFTSRF